MFVVILHFSQKLELDVKNGTLKKLLQFEKERNSLASDPCQKIKVFVITQNYGFLKTILLNILLQFEKQKSIFGK